MGVIDEQVKESEQIEKPKKMQIKKWSKLLLCVQLEIFWLFKSVDLESKMNFTEFMVANKDSQEDILN